MAKRAPQQSLDRWTKEDWGTSSGKKSSETGERYLPRAARESLTASQRAAGNQAKRKAMKAGKKKAAYTEAETKAYLKARMKSKGYGKKKGK
jgi:hypothetical protein